MKKYRIIKIWHEKREAWFYQPQKRFCLFFYTSCTDLMYFKKADALDALRKINLRVTVWKSKTLPTALDVKHQIEKDQNTTQP